MSSQGSRLIQLRYQQKQMHDNGQKKSDLYGNSFDETQKMLTSSLGAGKVRQMFDERRHRITAGIDKSYLLEPIVTTTTTTTTKRVIQPPKPTRDPKANYTKVIVPPLQNRLINHDINGNNHFSANEDPLNKTLVNFKTTKIAAKVPASDKLNTTVGATRKLTPAVTNSSPLKNVTNQKSSPVRSMKSGNSSTSSGSVRSVAMSPSRGANRIVSATSAKTSRPAVQKEASVDEDDEPVPEGLIRCSICKRNFAEDRIEKHQVICQKTKTKKRKIYDASKKRVQGTEAESYLKKPISSARAAPKATAGGPPKNNANWRIKHEDFIKTIRAAKEMQTHLAKGGKLSDLPPPPPSENPDYVKCPHCQRRFNESAASRHIPICQNMQHNKPKPKPAAAKSGSFAKRR